MRSTTLVSGMLGTGKSTILEDNRMRCITIEAEAVQARAVELLKGDDFEEKYEWKVWEEQELRSQAPVLLKEALDELHPALNCGDKPLLIEGAFLVNDMFCSTLLGLLGDYLPEHLRDVEYFVLHLDAQVISDQIEHRGRPTEYKYIGNIARIESERDFFWYIACRSQNNWQQVKSHNDFKQRLDARIASNNGMQRTREEAGR